jgi:hypothetical protein
MFPISNGVPPRCAEHLGVLVCLRKSGRLSSYVESLRRCAGPQRIESSHPSTKKFPDSRPQLAFGFKPLSHHPKFNNNSPKDHDEVQ